MLTLLRRASDVIRGERAHLQEVERRRSLRQTKEGRE